MAVLIGPVSNWSVTGRTIVGHSWINTGGIRRQKAAAEIVVEIAVEAAVGAATEVAEVVIAAV